MLAMRRATAPAIIASALFLAGCAATSAPTAAPTETPEPGSTCLEVSAGAIAGLQWGLDQKQDNITIDSAAAVADPDGDSWLVAAVMVGPGLEDGQEAVWWTQQDPTTDGEFAYLSVDAYAAEFSGYLQPDGASSDHENAMEALGCVTG
jgi:hypothetical protein